jgi:hypothetical protein
MVASSSVGAMFGALCIGGGLGPSTLGEYERRGGSTLIPEDHPRQAADGLLAHSRYQFGGTA